ncbi:hypothetical protein QJS10_CPA01g00360 [Acorus calamus]|uniref:Uncharacterized protein n=1 Tax=Acorus calamus TaxID=4465 RepID=A0AAV9FIY2_ACOCL|nr:hypothetical protein QJS10_CPA01g00360 [Acorus calamus]
MDVGGDGSPSNKSVIRRNMITVSNHRFGDGDYDGDSIDRFDSKVVADDEHERGVRDVRLPCSVALAEYVWQQRSRFEGKTIVELGAGTSLPGLVASKVGANVVLTDNADRLEILGVTWGEWDEPLFALVPHIVLGADVLGHHLIELLMVKWGLKCMKLLDAFSFMPSPKAANMQGSIQLVEIALKDQ